MAKGKAAAGGRKRSGPSGKDPADLRTRAKNCARGADDDHWTFGAVLAEVKDSGEWSTWGHDSFAAYVEKELKCAYSRANRSIQVYVVFGPYDARLKKAEVSWSTLSEALPLKKQLGIEATLDLVEMGLEEVRRKKEALKPAQGELDIHDDRWKRFKLDLRLPPDVFREVQDMMKTARLACQQQSVEVTDENPWQLMHQIAVEYREAMQGQTGDELPPAEEAAAATH